MHWALEQPKNVNLPHPSPPKHKPHSQSTKNRDTNHLIVDLDRKIKQGIIDLLGTKTEKFLRSYINSFKKERYQSIRSRNSR
jgi:hypothetical protein